MEFTNFNLAAFISSPLIFCILNSKSATNCFMGNWLLGICVCVYAQQCSQIVDEIYPLYTYQFGAAKRKLNDYHCL